MFQFEINEQRENYLEARGRIVLNACPGSGKTTVIAKKIIDLEKEILDECGKYSGVACLSFTNTAKDEINNSFFRLSGRSIDFPHIVSTIDSFINQFITLPFYNLLDRNFERPKILDDDKFLDEFWKTTYKKGNQIKEGLKWPLNNFKGKNNRSIYYSYSPSSIKIEVGGKYSVDGKSPDLKKVDQSTFTEYCKHIKKVQFEKGLISTSDSAYIALFLLKKFPIIGKWLSLRFPHIIIDEAQDNSELQHYIFDKLVKSGLQKIELVGDPYQSLYEWRDAKPELFLNKYSDSVNWSGINLTDNRRSPQRIINCFSLLRKRSDSKINTACLNDLKLPIVTYKYNASNSPLIIRHFDEQCGLYGLRNNQIVVRGNNLKNQMLGRASEQKPWKSPIPYKLIEIKYLYQGNEIKEAVNQLRTLSLMLLLPTAEYRDRKDIEYSIKEDYTYNAHFLKVLENIPSFDLQIDNWTKETQLYLKNEFELDNKVDFELRIRSSKNFDKFILSESLNKHFKKSYSNGNIPITTVHQVKGKTLDAILVFFNEKKHKDTITFADIGNNQNIFPEEKKRIIYVAMSRPKHLLAMAFPASVPNVKIKSKFGNDVRIITEIELNSIQNDS